MILELIRNWNILEQFLVTVTLMWIITHILKYIFNTKRPKESTLKSPGWPSAHTATAFAGIMFLNGYMFVIGFIGALLIAYTRLKKKHHTLFDIICGLIIGTVFGEVMILLFSII